jgi:hypothetical protein
MGRGLADPSSGLPVWDIVAGLFKRDLRPRGSHDACALMLRHGFREEKKATCISPSRRAQVVQKLGRRQVLLTRQTGSSGAERPLFLIEGVASRKGEITKAGLSRNKRFHPWMGWLVRCPGSRFARLSTLRRWKPRKGRWTWTWTKGRLSSHFPIDGFKAHAATRDKHCPCLRKRRRRAALGERIHRTITIHEMRKLMEGKQNSFADFSQQVFEKEQGRSSGDFLSSLSGSSC